MTDVEAPALETGVETGVGETEEDVGEFSFLSSNEKEPNPCQNFRLDTTAGFGMCKCGHPKAAHKEKEKNKAAEMLSKLKEKNKRELDNLEGIVEPDDGPCNKFRVDTTANEFGMCKCGFTRNDHSSQATNKAKQALDRLKSSNLDKYKDIVTNLNDDGPCHNYRVDVSASEFGLCHCGHKKEDHTHKEENAAAKMLRNLRETNKAKNEKENQEAIGIVEEKVTQDNQLPDVKTLNKAEAAADSEVKVKKKGRKRNGPCVIC